MQDPAAALSSQTSAERASSLLGTDLIPNLGSAWDLVVDNDSAGKWSLKPEDTASFLPGVKLKLQTRPEHHHG
ncbi:hypothetical protein ACTWQD_13530 [Pseudarthrobacter sp. 1C304]